MKKYILILVLTPILICNLCYAKEESIYSQSLSRMEREWLKQEYILEDDEERIIRLEERVFGTIQDSDLKTRYKKLRRAFDVKKEMQQKRKWYNEVMSGVPTSIPMNVEGLMGE